MINSSFHPPLPVRVGFVARGYLEDPHWVTTWGKRGLGAAQPAQGLLEEMLLGFKFLLVTAVPPFCQLLWGHRRWPQHQSKIHQ